MAFSGSSCIIVEHKRDFDLSIVLDALRKAIIISHSKSTSPLANSEEYSARINAPSTGVEGSVYNRESWRDANEISIDDCTTGASLSTSAEVQRLKLSSSPNVQLLKQPSSSFEYESHAIESEPCIEVAIHQYLTAFTELTRFFKLTGPVFAFVARDLAKKIVTVKHHLESTAKDKYTSLNTMIEYELKLGTVGSKGSGTRTMLRLHWALEFFIEFMDKLKDATVDTKTSTLVYDTYQRTLATHHPWWTRKLAYLAVFTLPPIRTLIDIMCKQDYSEVKVLLAKVVEIGRLIVKYTSSLYESHGLSNIT